MSDKIYIIGHQSPDLDSVVAAVSYANLKNLTQNARKNHEGTEKVEYVPAIAGKVNQVTEYILKKFGFDAPDILNDADGKI